MRTLAEGAGWARRQGADGTRYTQLTLYALGAAIPQAFLLLHAVLDILPYPVGPKGMWYELTTTTVECTDEVQAAEEGDAEDEFAGLGALEAAPISLATRTKVR